jgi:hypothetical protein
MVQVNITKAYIKLVFQYQLEPLTTASQSDVLDHPANPSARLNHRS